MTDSNRRAFLGGLLLATGGLAASQSLAAGNDGHALGYDVAPASDPLALIPRRTGDPVTFTASLDKSPIKATSGGGPVTSPPKLSPLLPTSPVHTFISTPAGFAKCTGTIRRNGRTFWPATAK